MRIDEFLQKYTTVEIDKSVREGIDPLVGKRPSSPKKLLQKIENETN